MNHNHLQPPGCSGMNEPTKVEQLVTSIVHKEKLARECKEQEQRASSERNSYECQASNALIALAKELVASLSKEHALRLTRELMAITGWRDDSVRVS